MIIATITDVLGDVFIRKVDGTIANVVSGDTIESGDVIVNGDTSSQYRVAYADNGGTMRFSGTAPQLFDPTMIPSHHEGSESVIDTTSANPFTPSDPANLSDLQHPAVARKKREEEDIQIPFAVRTANEVDINSNAWNLQTMVDNQKKVLSAIEKGEEPTTPEGFTFGEREAQLLRAQEDLFDPRTGNQTRPNSGLRQAQFDENYQNPKDYFEDRTGQQTDVNSDLRNAKFLGARREYEEDGIFYGDNSDHETPVIPINRPPLAVADRNDVTVNAEDALGHDDGDATTTIIVGGTILGNDTDPDGNDIMTITSISGVDKGVIDGTTIGKYGTLLLNHDGTYTYTLDDSPLQMQALAVGETLTDTFTYTIVDRAGQFSSSTTLSIVIHGVNNVPVFTVSMGDSDSAAITETNTTLSTTGTLSIGDVDTTDTITATSGGIVSVGGTYQGALPTEAQLSAMFGVSGGEPSTVKSDNPHGIVWNFNSGSHSFDPIPVGETVTLTYRVDATDNHGVTRSHDVTITITGTNDIPIAVADTNSVTEDAEDVLGHEDGKSSTTIISGSTVLANDTDVDTGDTKTVSGVQAGNHNGDLSNATTLGQGVTGNYGTVIMNADGTYTYALNNNDVRVQHLASGEKLTDVFSYTAKDSQGATSTTTLTITINGTNDAPTITPVDGNDTGNGTHIGGQATVYEASL
ncbi:MAG: VCBS domain-containing protein, partial [Sulfuricurvum sp.]